MPRTARANALPTKQFFVYMLTRDISLVDAITDLVDNSVDGARRTRPSGDYEGLWVRVVARPDEFRIADNCGGIPLDIAERYAFRFGRDPRAPTLAHSIGQFGVGMKRALFKIGSAFDIESTTATSCFTIHIDLAEWQDRDKWDFPISDITECAAPVEERGVVISVKGVHEPIAADFVSLAFERQLAETIRSKHEIPMAQGLAISVNGVPLTANVQQLLASDDLRPAFEQHEYLIDGATVALKLYAGVSTSSPADAGWYVYCNGRQILGADQTSATGWGAGGEATIPKYHNQFARFRGFAFFDSDDASKLPWTTTKTGIDTGSSAYRAALARMINLMRPIIDFLNALDAEKSMTEADAQTQELGSLSQAVAAAEPRGLASVTTQTTFTAPPPRPRKPTVGNILYQRPLDQIRRIQQAIGASSYREVGEQTFDHFLEYEIGDD